MARGGPTIGDNGISATPEELNNLTSLAQQVFLSDLPDLHNVDQVHAAIMGYFDNCQKHGVRPGNLGLYAALGLSRQDYNNLCAGKLKNKVNPECMDIIQKAHRAIGVYREGLALTGKLNPVTYIFMGKNYDSLSDTTTLEVQQAPAQTPTLSPAEIQKQIEKDIPIDTQFKELSDN